jgi:cell wall-associated NlpC family hydrolase
MHIGRLMNGLFCSSFLISSLMLTLSSTTTGETFKSSEYLIANRYQTCILAEDDSAENNDQTASLNSEAASNSNTKKSMLYGPAPDGCGITIVAKDIQVAAGTTDFSIMEGVTGRLDTGDGTFVWLVNDGGFSIDIPGRYYVTYAAMKSKGLEYKKRKIIVTGERVRTTIFKANDENYVSRYERFIKFIIEKGTDLVRVMNTLDVMYKNKVEEVISRGKIPDSIESIQDKVMNTDMKASSVIQVTNWPDIIATFIAIYSVDVSNPYNLNFLCSLPYEELESVFWDMNTVSVNHDEEGAHIVLDTITYTDVAKKYDFSTRQVKIQQELMRPEYLRSYATLTGLTNRSSYTVQDPELLSLLTDTALNERKKTAIQNACSLVGKVNYVWGGKYNKLGEHPEWNVKDRADSSISGSESEKEVFGLDCSGFISWVLINTCGNEDMLNVIGNGSSNQWWHSSPIAWEEGQPGDLIFFAAPNETDSNHVGIIVAKDSDGSYLVAHCSSKDNGVVITDAWSRGFRYIRRPILYEIMEATSNKTD